MCCAPSTKGAQSAPMSDQAREFDVIVYGATGFVGVLVARHLAGFAPAGTRIALAGRSPEKLEAVRTRLNVDWPIVVADATDTAALDTMAARTRVVITTAGPYAKYGRILAHACAEAGTDYVDLTGEVLFAGTASTRTMRRHGVPGRGSCTRADSTRSRPTSACTCCTRWWRPRTPAS